MQVIHKGQVTTYPTLEFAPPLANDTTITLPSQSHRPACQTRDLILGFVEDCGELSVLEIARHLQRKPTPFLRSQLTALVNVGLLIEIEQIRPNGARKFTYRVGA